MEICLLCLIGCVIFSALFIPYAVGECCRIERKNVPMIVIPITADTENIEEIWRSIVVPSEYYGTTITIADFGENDEIMCVVRVLTRNCKNCRIINIK